MTISDLTRNDANVKYPNFTAVFSKIASAEMVKLLMGGECQLIGTLASTGQKAVLRTISPTPNNVRLLLMVVDSMEYNISPTTTIPIKSVEDYMEVV